MVIVELRSLCGTTPRTLCPITHCMTRNPEKQTTKQQEKNKKQKTKQKTNKHGIRYKNGPLCDPIV